MSSKKLHVLICSSWYPSKWNPIDGTFVREQALMLLNAGYKVSVLHPSLNGSFTDTLSGKFGKISISTEDKITVFHLGYTIWLPGFRKFHYNQLCRKSYKKILKYFQNESKIDIIHSHSTFMGGIVGMHISKKLNIPLVHTEHASDLVYRPEIFKKIEVDLLKALFAYSKKIIFVSRYSQEMTQKNFNLNQSNNMVIPNLVDSSFFEESPIKRNGTDLKFLMIGWFIPIKGHDMLFKAWEIVHEKQPLWKLILVGNGILRDNYKNWAKELGIYDSIIWKNHLNREEIKEEMGNADVIISSSLSETFGLTIAEALARGKPVVCTDSGGSRDIIDETNGILLTENTAQEMAKAILTVGNKLYNYPSNNLRENAYKKYSENAISSILNELYQNISKSSA